MTIEVRLSPEQKQQIIDIDQQQKQLITNASQQTISSGQLGLCKPSLGTTTGGRSPQRSNVNGPMRLGESLYAKWRIKATGDIYEDTVDLRNRLPREMTDHRVYFMIKGPQLYVYLIPPEYEKAFQRISTQWTEDVSGFGRPNHLSGFVERVR